ncbi:MAG: DUF5916 domain-containing protein [Acidobacteriota bacterium]
MRRMFGAVVTLLVSLTAGAEEARLHITRAAGPITIDGDLSDAGWKDALRFDTWYETNPGDNVEPSVKTTGWVTYDDRFFYVAIESLDPNPSKIQSVFSGHDGLRGSSDDFAGVLLDTRNDGKTATEFFVSARGTQFDAVLDDTSGNEDSSPDFFWDSQSRLTDKGWILEMRIPFSSLRYKSADPQEWGVLLYRNMPRDRRYQIFSHKLPRGKNCFVCSYGKVDGFEHLPAGGHIVVAPYVTARLNGESRDGLGSPLGYSPAHGDGGLDIKWNPNAVTAVDGTLNPDFSQVESDTAAISTNERFAIFFPEKRPFFLEGVELFSTPIQAVYTRTITSPRWGLRSTGKVGSNAYTLLVAEDRGGGSVILPSATGSAFADQDFSSCDLIGRLRHDFGRNSFASFLITDREVEGGGHNRVLGPDIQWKPNDRNTFTGQLLLSETRTPERPDLADEWNGQKLTSHAAYVWWNYSDPKNDLYSEYKDYGKDFRADSGFVPEVGYRSTYLEGGRTFRPKGFFSRIRTFAMGQYDSQQDGAMLYRLYSGGVGGDAKFRSSFRFRFAYDKVRNGDDMFQRHRLFYTVNFAVNHIVSLVSVDGWLGQDVDFANSRLGRGSNTTISGTIRPTNHLEITLSNTVRWLNVGRVASPSVADRLFTSQVERLRAQYTFTPRMFVRAIIQNQRTRRAPQLYNGYDPQNVDGNQSRHSGSLATQVLLAYQVNWQSVVYIGAGDLRGVTANEGDFEKSARQVFMKVSYAFQR